MLLEHVGNGGRDRARAQTAKARSARRCGYVKPDGVRCGSPALRHLELCWQHREQPKRVRRARLRRVNGTQAALDYVLSELAAGRMDMKVAGALLYGLQSVVAQAGPQASPMSGEDEVGVEQ